MKVLSGIIFAAILLSLLPAFAFAGSDMPFHDLTVKIDPDRNAITGISLISLPPGRTARINFAGIEVLGISLHNRPLTVDPGTESLAITPGSSADVLKIEYRAEYPPLTQTGEGEDPGVRRGNYLSTEGVFLAENWHPVVEGRSLYRLTAVVPPGFESISEAEEIKLRELPDNRREFLFHFNHPLRTLTLIAGKYHIEKETRGETDIYTYFFPGDAGLSQVYRGYAGTYLDRYEKYLGKYPFRRFVVVENFLSASHALPTFSLLGKDIVKTPVVASVSLGQGILRQWIGNLVYTDEKGGDWSRGLSAYLAGHMDEEEQERGWSYRKQILLSFQNYVLDGKDVPLSSFRAQEDRPSAAIGYGKSAMVFHMLKKMGGDEAFSSSLRRFAENNSFKAASWLDIRDAFESVYGRDLKWFFQQWVDETSMPELEISDLELKYRGGKAVISFVVGQKGKNFKLLLPVVVKLRQGEVRKVFEIEKEPKTFVEIETGAEDIPVSLIIDDHYDLFRKLSDEEVPPVISRLLGDDKKVFVIPREQEDLYGDFAEFLKQAGFTEQKESDLSYETIRSSSLLIPGIETSVVKRLFGKVGEWDADFYLTTRQNPFNNKRVISIIGGRAASSFQDHMRKVTRYDAYSDLSFQREKITSKTVHEAARGIRSEISQDIPGVEIPRVTDLYKVIEAVAGKDVIYVGEAHDRFEHHRVQLQVIMQLYRKNKNIAIGMEMFQKSSQQALDDYIEGRTDEKTFLKKAEYFKQWGFDYNLYREILLFAREYKIPVIALNVRKDLVSKVSRGGLQSLSNEELKEIPEYFDLSDRKYRERLRIFFDEHTHATERNFDFFFQAQVLWDESMAHNLDEFIRKNPEYKVVVVAGIGHMAFGSGIPKRLFRLNKRDYAVVLNAGDVEKDVADFVLFPAPVQSPESPKLMVMLKEEDKKVMIDQFAPESIAEKAGMEAGDTILSLDWTLVESVDDIRIFLLSKKKGEEVTVRVLRQRFLFGPVEKEFRVRL